MCFLEASEQFLKVWEHLELILVELMLIFINEHKQLAYAHNEHKHMLKKIFNFEKWILRVK